MGSMFGLSMRMCARLLPSEAFVTVLCTVAASTGTCLEEVSLRSSACHSTRFG